MALWYKKGRSRRVQESYNRITVIPYRLEKSITVILCLQCQAPHQSKRHPKRVCRQKHARTLTLQGTCSANCAHRGMNTAQLGNRSDVSPTVAAKRVRT